MIDAPTTRSLSAPRTRPEDHLAAQDVAAEGHDRRGGRPLEQDLVHHPVAGALELDYESLEVAGSARQHLVAYTAPVGSPSEESLRLLAGWSASSRSSKRAPAGRDATTDTP